MNKFRRPMGKLISRDSGRVLQGMGEDEPKPGAMFTAQFRSKFSGGVAVETVTCSLEKDGAWRLSGYYINPFVEQAGDVKVNGVAK